ncbi:hypothetical protein AB670_01770 [Chryseobacterium sp. MOF25P]|uniref:DUF4236 domain-containing protein n=1 Tax=unclassified Chryseobacterium TaxID=2593645 RepID=UPI00080527A2|nr:MULTISPECIES: DUF4236 domain-containing protein [unclassified Chryseobacterium]OBW41955.1 hypothetical protein AB670_01770 [Chryseobacterium sp. MOF25P]OBW45038.1 hypothetical protein AB671_02767 [Chryseobacterium sp. BGARF1]
MAWSYRKRIKIVPGVHLNFSKRGISTSIGVKGASVNFSSSGTRLNTNVLGFSNSYQISGSSSSRSPQPQSQPLFVPDYHRNLSDNIFSADVHEITSQGMSGIKESILVAQRQKIELERDLKKIKKALSFSKTKKIASYILIYGFINKKVVQTINQDINAQKEAIIETKIVIDNSAINIDVQFDDPTKRKYERFYNAFKNLSTSHRIWDITGAHFQNRVAARSNASTLVNRRETKIGLKSLSIIKSNYEALYFQNINGADLYFYPTFVIMYTNNQKFAIIGLDELNLMTTSVSFTETSSVPRDSKVIRKTWAKVNKNGTPDKRFKNNYQIPVVQYGRIHLSTSTGVNEEYQISNFEFTKEFGDAFQEYKNLCRVIDRMN